MIDYIYSLTENVVEEPQIWDSFHMQFLIWVAVSCAVLGIIIGRTSDRTFRFTIMLFWLAMLFGEAFKQIATSLEMVDGTVVFNYDWSDFPFQLCSTPIYVLPFLAFLKDGRMRDFAAAYIVGYGLIGGLAVYFVPHTVFGEIWVFNMHSMIHHGIQIITGVITAVRYKNRVNLKFFMKGWLVFVLMFTVAMLLNTVFYDYLIEIGELMVDDTFNMFLVSPNMEFNIPVFTDMFNTLSSWQMIAVYFVGVPLGTAVIMRVVRVINLGINKKGVIDVEKR